MKHTRHCQRLAEYIRIARYQGKERIMVTAIVNGLVDLFGVGAKAFLAALGILV
ncbi:hypothetical protein [Nocardia brasiliensis]|uniref:hypothetical protein n=1 Tax=Nocardia brasiliensis TaxID=37326 RepID=UPI00366EEA67